MYMHIDWQHNFGAIPLPFASLFWFPFASLPFPFTYLETLLDVIGSRPPWSQVAHKLISPSPSPPHSKIPTSWGFPELNVRLTKTTSQIWLTRSRRLIIWIRLDFYENNMLPWVLSSIYIRRRHNSIELYLYRDLNFVYTSLWPRSESSYFGGNMYIIIVYNFYV